MIKRAGVIRVISLLLAFILLVGCGANQSQEKKKGKIIKEIKHYNEEVPGEGAVYGEEPEYEYYDDQYTTNPGKWTISKGGRRTVQNLSNYSFDETKYANVTYSGGSDVRTENFIRGVGITQKHATEGYNLSNATKAQDMANFKELNITSKRTWGESTNGILSNQFDYAGTLHATTDVVPADSFADGTLSTVGRQFSNPSAAANILSYWTSKLTDPLLRKQNKVLLIGNEYRNYFRNNTTGSYEWSGYDDITLNDFRNNWCKTRFGTIAKLNQLCGTSYHSFAEVYPKRSSSEKLFYEFYLYQREVFRKVFKQAVTGIKETYPDTKWGFAGYRSNVGSYTDYLYLDYLDYTSQNAYYGSYMDNFHGWSFSMDNLAAWSKTAPVIVTEVGWKNGDTDKSKAETARKYKQGLNLFYMRPRYIGTYIFTYAGSDKADIEENSTTWGMVDGYRNRYPAFNSVAQVYTDFKYLDKFYTGASNTPLVAISNMSTDDTYAKGTVISRKLAGILYSQGVPVQVVPSDNASRFDSLKETKLIYNDTVVFQNPDGSNHVGEALERYLKKGNSILRTSGIVPSTLYGIGSAFSASSYSALAKKYTGLICKDQPAADETGMWNLLGKFIHGDFISGKITAGKNKIDENAVRILEIKGMDNIGIVDPTWNIEAKMVYKDGEMYLCLVNIGDNPIDRIEVTIGVNNGVLCNLTPRILRADGNVSTFRPERANIPSYIESESKSKVSFGTLTVENLDTYAYIYVGKAVIK